MSVVDFLKQRKQAVEAELESAVELEEKLSDLRAQIVTAEKQLAAIPKGKEALAKLSREIQLAQGKLAAFDEQTQVGIAEQHRRVVLAAVCMVSNLHGAADLYLRLCGWTGINALWFHDNESPDGLPVASALRLRLIRELGPLFPEIERRLSVTADVDEARRLIADLLK